MPGELKVHGVHACLAVFERRPEDVQRAWVTEGALGAARSVLRELARRRRPYKVVGDEELARVAGSRHHEGLCLLVVDRPPATLEEVTGALGPDAPAAIVYLDGVANPHNLGAILRSCAHFGATAIVGREGALPRSTGAAARVAQGGAEHVPVIPVADEAAALATLATRGFTVVATEARGAPDLFAAELPPRVVWLLGSERGGLSAALRAAAPRSVTIGGTGAVESLNVAAACAVLLAEHRRRHGWAPP